MCPEKQDGGGHNDRQIARTRYILQDALNSLTLKVGDEAVTIEGICDAANVGRATFYANFTSKDDLSRSGLDRAASGSVSPSQRLCDRSGGGKGKPIRQSICATSRSECIMQTVTETARGIPVHICWSG